MPSGVYQRTRGVLDTLRVHRRNRMTHGLSGLRAYNSWFNMRNRCSNPDNPSYPRYGGRGITVCDRWSDFANFYADMGERPEGMTLDRRDNDGNYEPGNCRWATRSEQQRHRTHDALGRWS